MAKSVLILTASLVLLLPTSCASRQSIVACNADKIKEAMDSCDKLVNISQIKCDNPACHKALHVLVDDEYLSCYDELKLGSKSDLAKYKELDDFCHGEGPDPLEKATGTVPASNGNATSTSGSNGTDKEESVTATPSAVPAPASAPTAKPNSRATSLVCGASTITLAVGFASFV